MRSDLTNYIVHSPHYKVDRDGYTPYIITPHCYVGKAEITAMGKLFQGEKIISANYGIDLCGQIGCFVEEEHRSMCSSSAWNDKRAITVECASDHASPYQFPVSTYESLIELTVDICRRYNKNKIMMCRTKEEAISFNPASYQETMIITQHNFFANKSCPGEWFINQLPSFVKAVNDQLGSTLYCVQVGAYKNKINAIKMKEELEKKGYNTYITTKSV